MLSGGKVPFTAWDGSQGNIYLDYNQDFVAKKALEEAYDLQHAKDIGGFLDSKGYATADDGKTKIKFTGNVPGGGKYSIKTASMERRTDLAGQTVKVGRETLTYDDKGYAVSKKVDRHATGTLSAPGGLSLVGEKGPELRVLNSGDGIIPADATRNLWDWAKFSPKEFNGGTMIHIANLNLPNVRDGNDFVKYMVNNFWRETVQYAST